MTARLVPPLARDVRGAVLASAVGLGAVVLLSTELLSLLRGLTRGPVLAVWALAVLGGALAWARGGWPLAALRARAARSLVAPRPSGPPAPGRHLVDRILAGSVALIVIGTGVLAVRSVPTTWDSMSYHLARVAHWAQNESVAFYPAHVVRQLYQPPWAEYAVLQLFVVAGGDRLVNLVQWAAMVGSLVAVSAIARELGAGARGQLLSALVCATIPMGIMQASTTQNDYVLAFWLACLTSVLLSPDSGRSWPRVLAAGVSLGLAVSTKGTAYVLAPPLLAVLGLAGAGGARKRVGQALAIAAIALALNTPHYARNAALFGRPLGPGGDGPYRYANDELSARVLGSNLLRNAALQLGTPVPAVNEAIERAVALAHRAIGAAVDDPRSTWPGTSFRVPPPVAHEDAAGNGLHLLLIAAALPAAWRRGGQARALSIALGLALALFCLALRWQPWHSRLLLPLFVLGAPLVGLAFERLRGIMLALLLVPLELSALFFLTQSRAHPLWGRQSVVATPWSAQRLAHAGRERVEATRLAMAIGCRTVGLAVRDNDQEYFYWALLADARWPALIRPVLVANASAALSVPAPGDPRPCAIVREGGPRLPADGIALGDVVYRAAWTDGDVQLWIPAPAPRAAAPPSVTVLLDRDRARPGERVAVGVDVRIPRGGEAAHVYLGVMGDDGHRAMFADGSGSLRGPIALDDPGAFPRAVALDAGATYRRDAVADLSAPRGERRRTYWVFAVVARPVAGTPGLAPGSAVSLDIRAVVVAR